LKIGGVWLIYTYLCMDCEAEQPLNTARALTYPGRRRLGPFCEGCVHLRLTGQDLEAVISRRLLA
jgi:hypothetical protein